MPRGKRGVKFPHKGNNGHAADGRRSSFSDYSEDGSPVKQRSGSGQQAPLDGIAEQPPQSPAEAAAEEKRVAHEKRKTDFKVRTFWTFVMFAGFFTALFSGHIYIICVMTVIQVVSFKEVIAIASVPSRARQLRPSKSLNWYWLATTMYFLYGESVIYYFKHIVLVDKVLLPLATHHRFISFFLYIFGFVFFVTTLHAGHFKFQFTQFAWTHMALYLIVVQAHFVMNNVFEGLIWFFLPASLVITNDIFAYIVGMTFGRTQLIKLSPKKTVEGFVGAWVFTIVFGIIIANILTRSSYFICPAHDLAANIFTGLECTPNPAFLPKTYSLPDLVFLPPNTDISFTVAPIQFHTLVLATFASLIAPFGGFFASGLKRTFKIKDFGDSIPGHGGMTDRMDCQFIMGFFTYIYFHTFVSLNKEASLGAVMEMAITGLTLDEQKELITGLGRYLSNQGLINGEALSECLDKSLLPA